ncbi:MAG TPA: hypothetical protein VIL74_12265 [Pyrinomonadaceae bacterium]|jgi:hypothetical protein
MKFEVPAPLPTTWLCKPVESAASGVDILADGRVFCWIEHEILNGVTPEMLVWWFSHLEGEVEIDGARYDRYRVWHPRDHLFAEYVKRNADGTVGVGSVIHLAEMFDANPKYLIHIFTEIVKLDETGYIHQPRMHGLRLAEMEYAFEPVAGGTKYRNSLTFGIKGRLGRLLNPLLRRFFFDEKRGRAWLKHNIEEVGNFEFFLPKLFESENERTALNKKISVQAAA